MDVNVYFYLVAPVRGKRRSREFLSNFLSDIQFVLDTVCDAGQIAWGKSPLAPEPSDLIPSFDDEGVLTLPFRFSYKRLSQAVMRVELLECLMKNLIQRFGYGIEYFLEYHLDPD